MTYIQGEGRADRTALETFKRAVNQQIYDLIVNAIECEYGREDLTVQRNACLDLLRSTFPDLAANRGTLKIIGENNGEPFEYATELPLYVVVLTERGDGDGTRAALWEGEFFRDDAHAFAKLLTQRGENVLLIETDLDDWPDILDMEVCKPPYTFATRDSELRSYRSNEAIDRTEQIAREISNENQAAVLARAESAFKQATGEFSLVHKRMVQWAIRVAVDTAKDEWAYDTLEEEPRSYLHVLHTDFSGALSNLNEPGT
jgi:hypothetical protein